MANSYVDKYFFALMLDAKGFKSGANTAVSAITSIKNAFLQTYSLIGGFDLFKNMLASYTTAARSIDQLNLMTGINTRDMQAWQKTIQDTGGDINAFNNTLAKLADMQAQIKRYGTAEGLGEFLRVGIDVRGKSPIEVLKDVNRVLKSVKDAPEAFNIAKRLGIDESSYRIMRLYGENLEKVVNTNKRYAVMSRQDLLNARQYEKIVSDFKTSWLKLSREVMTKVLPILMNDLLPYVEKITNVVVDDLLPAFIDLLPYIEKTAGKVAEWAGYVGEGIGEMVAGEEKQRELNQAQFDIGKKAKEAGLGLFEIHKMSKMLQNVNSGQAYRDLGGKYINIYVDAKNAGEKDIASAVRQGISPELRKWGFEERNGLAVQAGAVGV